MLKIPTIEETIEANAYEARMHFLCPDDKYGRYMTQPGHVSEPTGEAVRQELAYNDYPGFLMWVTFAKPEATGRVETHRGPRYTFKSHPVVGKWAVSTSIDTFQMLDELEQGEPESNTFLKMWLGKFAVDRGRNFFGDHRHPLGQLSGLYSRFGIREELDAVIRQSKEEDWDTRINTTEWYIASLAQLAKKDHPELFTESKTSWHKRMDFKLEHRPLPQLDTNERAA